MDRNKEYESLIINAADSNGSDHQSGTKRQTAGQKLYKMFFLFTQNATTNGRFNHGVHCATSTSRPRKIALFVVVAMIVVHFIHSNIEIIKRQGSSNSYSIHFKTKAERCKFDKNGPLPVVLMAIGRSGSSVTWNTLSLLTGDKTIAYEATGGNQNKSIAFFNDIPDHINERWASLRLCNIQRRHMIESQKDGRNYAIVGFQWKPYFATFDHPYALSGLQRLADDRIKVIYLTRNPLDRFISNQKHKGFVRSEEVPAHCKVKDVDCVNRHKARQKGISIDVSVPEKRSNFINHLKQAVEKDHAIRERLDMFGVKHINVEYEKLFDADARDDEYAEEWIRILNFLGFESVEKFTIGDIRRTFEYAQTTEKSHEKIISNYEQVKAALEGTEFFDLLH